jgi:hypothetical protein
MQQMAAERLIIINMPIVQTRGLLMILLSSIIELLILTMGAKMNIINAMGKRVSHQETAL